MQNSSEVQSVGQWMLTLFIMFIPIVNIIALLIWAFGSSTPADKANWAKALLIWMAIFFVLGILMSVLGGGLAMMSGGM